MAADLSTSNTTPVAAMRKLACVCEYVGEFVQEHAQGMHRAHRVCSESDVQERVCVKERVRMQERVCAKERVCVQERVCVRECVQMSACRCSQVKSIYRDMELVP